MTSIASNYEINIAVAHATRKQWGSDLPAYIHYATLQLDSSKMEADALAILADTRTRYPAPAFKVEMTHWRCHGANVGDEPAYPVPEAWEQWAKEHEFLPVDMPRIDIAMTTFDDADTRGVPDFPTPRTWSEPKEDEN